MATSADAAAIAAVLRDFQAEYEEFAPEQDWWAGRIAALMDAGDSAVLLVETGADELPVGVAYLRFRPSLYQDAPEASLAELYVRPDLRGQGLGRRLLTAAMDHAVDRGATSMDLSTTSADTAAVALYESMGFDRHERSGPDVTAYSFEIDLRAPSQQAPAAG
ncbi:GNAT family N-acetyltransferase [Nakamurella leprariae]|uniref:GNAT family N-acetyltransferase n=1 Tax=Nakamurella leprariae TaxID=2803911 RepID=A0A939BXT3_9ACTN|nr:GNAT family N-acetyltransferase [Nakamurella leprariae]MBM9466330.1 GNAT family N-acetyltransferase [Nakamurella leprariae]